MDRLDGTGLDAGHGRIAPPPLGSVRTGTRMSGDREAAKTPSAISEVAIQDAPAPRRRAVRAGEGRRRAGRGPVASNEDTAYDKKDVVAR
jgi:hypothetical protein